MKKVIETMSFWLKCLQAEVIFWRMNLSGNLNGVKKAYNKLLESKYKEILKK